MTNKEKVELTLRKLLTDALQIQIEYNQGIRKDDSVMNDIANLITDTARSIDQLYNEDKTL